MQFNAKPPLIDLPESEWRLWCIEHWPYQSSLQFAIPVGTITSNSPDTNSVAWTGVIVEYNGNQYTITDDNTSDKYLYWEIATPTVFAHSATIPTITENLIVVGINTTGDFQPCWKAGQAAIVANTVSTGALDGAVITGATIQTEATASRGVKLTSSNGLQGFDSSGNLTFKIHPTTGSVSANVFTGTSTHSTFDITTGGNFYFKDQRYSGQMKIITNSDTSALLQTYSSGGGEISLHLSSAGGTSNNVKIYKDDAGTLIATFDSAGVNVESGMGFKVAGTKVVGAQGAAVADATNSTDVITQLNTLLSRLRTHGLIDT